MESSAIQGFYRSCGNNYSCGSNGLIVGRLPEKKESIGIFALITSQSNG